MLENSFPPDQSIIECLNAAYGIEVATLTPLSLGADRNASVYKAQALGGDGYFIKLKRGSDCTIGVAVATLLYEDGMEQIILPLKTRQGLQTHCVGEFTLIVYPFIEGQDGFSRKLTSDQWVQFGKALRQVHELEVPLAIQKLIRQESYSSRWRDSVRTLLTLLDTEPAGDELAIKLWQFIKQKKEMIQRLVDRAELLGQKLKGQSIPFVLCHSDIHGGNVLLDGHHTLYMVDWDDPMLAPKERDLMFIGGGVGAVWNQPQEEAFFYRGYGLTAVNRELLAYYRHERIIEDIALYSQDLIFAPVQDGDKEEMYEQFIMMFVPQSVVDIAFKTDVIRQ